MSLDREAGERLRAYMEPRMGAVQPWAERHGIGRDTVYALWRGREPQPKTMARIADSLGITYDELLRIRAGIEKAPAEAGAGDLVLAIRELTAAILTLTPRSAPPLAEAAERQDALTDASSSRGPRPVRGRAKGR